MNVFIPIYHCSVVYMGSLLTLHILTIFFKIRIILLHTGHVTQDVTIGIKTPLFPNSPIFVLMGSRNFQSPL
jgi:hypothetical protein